MITIITVCWNSYDFLAVLKESLEIYTETPYELIVIDNSSEKQDFPGHVFPQNTNIGHGAGLNLGVKKSREMFPDHKYIMFLDVDCHVLCHGWEKSFIELSKDYRVIGGKGVSEKPIRPACMWLDAEIAPKFDCKTTPGYKGHRVTPNGYDVAIKAYLEMVDEGLPIKLIESSPNRYGTLNGEEWQIEGKSLVYHHWHGTHLLERGVDFPDDDLFYDKELLMSKIPWRLP